MQRAQRSMSRRLFSNWPFILPFDYLRTRLHPHLKQLLSKTLITLRLRNGLKIQARIASGDPGIVKEIWLCEIYAPFSFMEILDGEVILDVGAHIGAFTLLAASACPSSPIYCYEPMPENYEILLTNLRMNGIQNVKAYPTAISAVSGLRPLHIDETNTESHFLQDLGSDGFLVPTLTLAEVFRRHSIKRCGLLKMDCEGSEYEILFEASSAVLSRIGRISLEYHTSARIPRDYPARLVQFLESEGYDVTIIPDPIKHGLLYASREGDDGFIDNHSPQAMTVSHRMQLPDHKPTSSGAVTPLLG